MRQLVESLSCNQSGFVYNKDRVYDNYRDSERNNLAPWVDQELGNRSKYKKNALQEELGNRSMKSIF